MSKRIIYIVLGALFVFGVLFLIWSWFFNGKTQTNSLSGQFGTASDTAQTGGSATAGGNTTTSLGQNGAGQNATNGTIPLNGAGGTNGVGVNGAGGTANSGTSVANGGGSITIGTAGTVGTVSPQGVVWTNGGSVFTPADINSVANGAGGFTPTISTAPNGTNGGTSLITALAGVAIAGSLTCALQAGVVGVSSASASAGAGAGLAGILSTTPPGVSPGPNVVADFGSRAILNAGYSLQVSQATKNATKDTVTFQQCLINVIAKVALQQITISVVNWINSGFNGQPSFVNNFDQFFTNVADLSAGEFIKGSALSFLCSPFQLQIKIAIAQSYANRNAQSCSLTGIIKNVNNFMNGSFNQGGWPGFVQFTTVPTNNPYGAFAYAQVGLANAQAQAQANAKNNISPTGFLNLQKLSGCNNPSYNGIATGFSIGTNAQAAVAAGKNALPSGCKAEVVTPGNVIESSLNSTNDTQIKQLGIASDVDQIISALTTQLMTKILQNGLTSLSQSTTQTAGDLAAQQQAANLLIDMQGKVSIAQQIGTVDQQSISDIESAQSSLTTLANCWGAVASSTSSSAASATQKAADANSQVQTLNAQIEQYNNDITRLNAQIVSLNNFESQVSSASTQADVANANAGYSAAVSSGSFASQSDITTAQQNRTTLQSQMAALNQSTTAGMAQCQATH